MLKKIHTGDARIGMHVHEVCGTWMEHPFWKSSFRVSNDKILKTLNECGIHEIWIDISKGVDVDASVEAFSEEDEKLRVDLTLQGAIKSGAKPVLQVALHEELERARAIHSKTSKMVTVLFKEARMGRAMQLEQAFTLVDEVIHSMTRNQCAFMSLTRLKNKDNSTYLHSVAVCALMVALGRQMGLKDNLLREAGMAGLLHDIGKVMTPEEILNKPGFLSREEFEIMKHHPRNGWQLLQGAPGAGASALDVCLHHHERLDGTGYPDKLSADEVSRFARMGAICDVYDAITSVRCYKVGWEPAEAIRKMAEWKDGNYDETVFYAFIKTVGIYPVGSLVRLKSGRLGVVSEQSARNLLTPKITVFYSTRSKALLQPEHLDLSVSTELIAGIESAAKWGFAPDMLARMSQFMHGAKG